MEPQPAQPKNRKDGAAMARWREEMARWRALPIFRRRGCSLPMNTDSYKNSWRAAVEVAAQQFPKLHPRPEDPRSRMIVRDLRKTFRTTLRRGKVAEPVINELGGWSDSVSQGYDEQEWEEDLEAAIGVRW